MSNELATKKDIGEQITDAMTEIDATVGKCSPAALVAMPALMQAVVLAKGIRAIKKALTPEIMDRVIMPLQNSRLGFLTDRAKARDGKTEYSVDEVREVMVEAFLSGLQPVNNEVNIIAGNMYAAKNGVRRLCMTWPGVSGLVLTPGVPEMAPNSTALVSMRATWMQDGHAQEMYRGKTVDKDGVADDTRFSVRVNSGMGPDAIIGKAERKMFAAIFARLSGGRLSIADGDAIETTGETVSAGSSPIDTAPQGRRTSLRGNGKKDAPKPDADGVMDEPEPGSAG